MRHVIRAILILVILGGYSVTATAQGWTCSPDATTPITKVNQPISFTGAYVKTAGEANINGGSFSMSYYDPTHASHSVANTGPNQNIAGGGANITWGGTMKFTPPLPAGSTVLLIYTYTKVDGTGASKSVSVQTQ